MKIRQARKIISNLADERGLRYCGRTVEMARRVWDHHEDRHTRRFVDWMRSMAGDRGFFELQIDCGLALLESRYSHK